MITVLLAVLLGVLLLFRILVFRPKNFPPGPPCLPVIGTIPFIPSKNVHFVMMAEWKKKYGNIVGLMMGQRPAVAISGAEEVLEALRRDEFQGRPDTFNSRDRAFNKRLGFFFNDGPAWLETRRFTLRHLRDLGFGKRTMEGLILEEVEELIERMKRSKIQRSGTLGLSVINILWAVVGGTRYSHNDARIRDLLDKISALFRTGNPSGDILDIIPFLRFISTKIAGYKERKTATVKALSFLEDTVKEHMKTLDDNEPRDYIDVYLAEMKKNPMFSDEGLLLVCLDVFSAGAESVSNTIDYFFLYMLLNPDIQKKIQEELDTVIGHSRRPSLEDKIKLPMLEAAITETYRINPIAPQTPHHSTLCDAKLRGYDIPKGTTVLLNIYSVLNDPKHWGDPEVYRPERFIGANGKFVKDDWMINFGLGKRICLGESLARSVVFLFTATFLQEFTFSIPEGDPKPSTYPVPGFTTCPQKYRMEVKQRL